MTLQRTLARNHGVASRHDILAAGTTAFELSRAVHSGQVDRVRRAWYALPDADPRVRSAVRVGGALTCISELDRRGLWVPASSRVHVSVAANASRLREPDGARVHWRPRALDHVRSVDRLEVALAHAAGCLSPEYAVVALDNALNRRMVSRAALDRAFVHFPASSRRLLALVDPTSQSGLETLARVRLRSRGIGLRTQVAIAGVGRVDVLIGDRLVVELDGFGFHATGESFENDRRRDLALHALDIVSVRLSYRQVMTDWARAERVLMGMVRRGVHRWPRRGRTPRNSG